MFANEKVWEGSNYDQKSERRRPTKSPSAVHAAGSIVMHIFRGVGKNGKNDREGTRGARISFWLQPGGHPRCKDSFLAAPKSQQNLAHGDENQSMKSALVLGMSTVNCSPAIRIAQE